MADPRIKSIVLRVDSPGGDAIASHEIMSAIRLCQDEGKPVLI